MSGGGENRERREGARRLSVWVRGLTAVGLFVGGWACLLGLRFRPEAADAVLPLAVAMFVGVVPAILATVWAGSASDGD